MARKRKPCRPSLPQHRRPSNPEAGRAGTPDTGRIAVKPVDQTKFYVEGVSRGNCQQAATASILGLDLDAVPNFMEADEVVGFWGAYYGFLKQRGYVDIELPPTRAPDCFYLAYGRSSRGVLHAVVYRAGKLVHDPHPSREGVLEVKEIHLIVPIEIGTQATPPAAPALAA